MNGYNFSLRAFAIIFWITFILVFLFIPKIKRIFITDQSINVFAWVDMIDTEKIAQFERETGINVNVSYYESYNELLAKLRSEAEEYNLVFFTSYLLDNVDASKTFKKLDKSKLEFWDNVDPQFKKLRVDPTNKYFIPYSWDVYGIGYNRKKLPKNSIMGWDLIFNKEKSIKPIAMTDEPLEALSLAALYLFGHANNLTDQQLQKVKELMIEQKSWVECYTNLKADYFLISNSASAVVSQSAYVSKFLSEFSNLEFFVPESGSFLLVDGLAISSTSQKDELVYKLINFLYKEDVLKSIYDNYGYIPVLKSLLNQLNLDYLGKDILSDKRFDSLHLFGDIATTHKLNDIWIDIKAA